MIYIADITKFEIRIPASQSHIAEYNFSCMKFRAFAGGHLHRIGSGGQVEIRNKFEYQMTKCQKQNHCRGFDYMYGLEHLNLGHAQRRRLRRVLKFVSSFVLRIFLKVLAPKAEPLTSDLTQRTRFSMLE
jgi:hypothetical protein